MGLCREIYQIQGYNELTLGIRVDAWTLLETVYKGVKLVGKIESGGRRYFIQEDTDYDIFLVLYGEDLSKVLGSYPNRTLALEAIKAHSCNL